MIRAICTSITLMFASASIAQNTTRITIVKLPEYHATGSDLYLAGSFNGWNPKDSSFRFKREADGSYYIDLKLKEGKYEYKVTRGGWDKVETANGGRGILNRTLQIPAAATQLTIEDWSDRYPAEPRKSTATKNVQIIDTAFLIPQLNRIRRVWIYLPEDYQNQKNKNYPVLYMHDGQNLFDDATSFSGEWGVDEFMDSTKLPKSIVVAIDHGASKRFSEYSPYDNEQFGKGEGDAYVDFLVKTLKPYIDSHYRTLKDKNNTGIAGSSMGGLISLYAVLKYPEVYGKVGVFSPAFWVTGNKIFDAIMAKGRNVNSIIYFYGGKLEGEMMVPDMIKAYDDMKKVSKSKMELVVREDGKHNEPTWRKEFPAFYRAIW